jgi:hypothetical protein
VARNYAAEYARRKELATERGLTGADVTRAARGRATEAGLTSSSIRALERNPSDEPVKVVSYTDREGNSHVIVVTHDRKGRARTHDLQVSADKARTLQAQIDRIAKALGQEPY